MRNSIKKGMERASLSVDREKRRGLSDSDVISVAFYL